MASLSDTIESIFLGSYSNSQIGRQNYLRASNNIPITTKKYLEIPIGSDLFELPVLAFEAFRTMLLQHRECDTLVAQLYSCGTQSTYKSLDAIMKDVLSTKCSYHLSKVQVPGSPHIYYSTYGAVFDTNLTPIMMLSWIMERKADGDGRIMYHYRKPLLRLHPNPCVYKDDPLQKMLAGRILSNTLKTTVYTPYYIECSDYIKQSPAYTYRSGFRVKVEIDECPFVLREVDVPSISLTNEALLQMAADHIDEILQ